MVSYQLRLSWGTKTLANAIFVLSLYLVSTDTGKHSITKATGVPFPVLFPCPAKVMVCSALSTLPQHHQG